MTYYNSTTIKRDLSITDTSYDTNIADWGADADDEVDNILAPYTTVPLTTVPDIIVRAANQNVKYRYFNFLGQEERADSAYKKWMDIMDTYLTQLKATTNLIIASPDYRTYPLNSSASIYKSMSGSNNSTDDSDLS